MNIDIMNLDITPYLIVCPLVFVGGFIDSIAGGGGLVALPAYLLAGVPIHNAIATNKLSCTLGAVTSAIRYWKNSFVNVGFIMPSVVAALLGSVAGARLTLLVDEKYLQYLLIAVLPVSAYFVLKNKALDAARDSGMPRRRSAAIAAAISLAVGVYDGFYGPGTGTFLIILYSCLAKMDVRSASGNAKFVNFASNLGAFVLFMASGKMIIPLGLTAAVFSMAGAWAGSGLAIRKGVGVVRPVILVVLALLFIKVAVFGN